MLRHTIAAPDDRRRLLREHLGHDRLGRGAGEGRVAGEHLVEHATQRVDVAARVERALPHRLLGAHVRRRTERHPGLGHARASGLRGGECDAEVRHERMPSVQQDVLRLDVAVDHIVCVRVLQRIPDLARDAQRVVDRQLLLTREPVAQ